MSEILEYIKSQKDTKLKVREELLNLVNQILLHNLKRHKN
jgi:hypothetical protein